MLLSLACDRSLGVSTILGIQLLHSHVCVTSISISISIHIIKSPFFTKLNYSTNRISCASPKDPFQIFLLKQISELRLIASTHTCSVLCLLLSPDRFLFLPPSNYIYTCLHQQSKVYTIS